MRVRVRIATTEDAEWIMGGIREMANEQPYFSCLFDEDEAPRILNEVLLQGFSIVAEDVEQERLGFILGTITPHLFNPKLKLYSHQQWWVDPKHRNGFVTHSLFTAFVRIGRKCADMVTLSLRDDVNIKAGTLKKYGFERHDKCYIMFK